MNANYSYPHSKANKKYYERQPTATRIIKRKKERKLKLTAL
jgi:hypothetical protein